MKRIFLPPSVFCFFCFDYRSIAPRKSQRVDKLQLKTYLLTISRTGFPVRPFSFLAIFQCHKRSNLSFASLTFAPRICTFRIPTGLCSSVSAEKRQKQNSEVVPNEESCLLRFQIQQNRKQQIDRYRFYHRERSHHRLRQSKRKRIYPCV